MHSNHTDTFSTYSQWFLSKSFTCQWNSGCIFAWHTTFVYVLFSMFFNYITYLWLKAPLAKADLSLFHIQLITHMREDNSSFMPPGCPMQIYPLGTQLAWDSNRLHRFIKMPHFSLNILWFAGKLSASTKHSLKLPWDIRVGFSLEATPFPYSWPSGPHPAKCAPAASLFVQMTLWCQRPLHRRRQALEQSRWRHGLFPRFWMISWNE